MLISNSGQEKISAEILEKNVAHCMYFLSQFLAFRKSRTHNSALFVQSMSLCSHGHRMKLELSFGPVPIQINMSQMLTQ